MTRFARAIPPAGGSLLPTTRTNVWAGRHSVRALSIGIRIRKYLPLALPPYVRSCWCPFWWSRIDGKNCTQFKVLVWVSHFWSRNRCAFPVSDLGLKSGRHFGCSIWTPFLCPKSVLNSRAVFWHRVPGKCGTISPEEAQQFSQKWCTTNPKEARHFSCKRLLPRSVLLIFHCFFNSFEKLVFRHAAEEPRKNSERRQCQLAKAAPESPRNGLAISQKSLASQLDPQPSPWGDGRYWRKHRRSEPHI